MPRFNDRPAGRRPRAPRPIPARRQLPHAVQSGLAWCDRVRFEPGPARLPAHEWGDWADEIVSLVDGEGGVQ